MGTNEQHIKSLEIAQKITSKMESRYKIKPLYKELVRGEFSELVYIKTELNYESEDRKKGIPHSMEGIFEKVEEESKRIEVSILDVSFKSSQYQYALALGESKPTEEQRDLCEKAVNGELVEKEKEVKPVVPFDQDYEESLHKFKEGLKDFNSKDFPNATSLMAGTYKKEPDIKKFSILLQPGDNFVLPKPEISVVNNSQDKMYLNIGKEKMFGDYKESYTKRQMDEYAVEKVNEWLVNYYSNHTQQLAITVEKQQSFKEHLNSK